MPLRPTRDAIAGGLYGLLIGDAVGVPYEFKSPATLPPLEMIELAPPAGFRRSHVHAPQGAWSDDGAQGLCLLASLLDRGHLDIVDFGERLLKWLDSGYLAVDGVVFDVGNQTRAALGALRMGSPAESAGLRGEGHNGNGSLMRVLPLALWHRGSDEELVNDAARQSLVTHAHARSQVCCALYCLWTRATLQGLADPWGHATATLRKVCANNALWKAELESHVLPDASPHGSGSGYVVDSLHSARLATQEATFELVIKRAVSLGNDTDTTAAVAGGIAGVRHGLSGIPKRWLAALAGRELVDPLAQKLLAHLGIQ